MGPTPVIKYSLSPGRHTVKAVPQTGKPKTTTIVIESGKMSTHRFTW